MHVSFRLYNYTMRIFLGQALNECSIIKCKRRNELRDYEPKRRNELRDYASYIRVQCTCAACPRRNELRDYEQRVLRVRGASTKRVLNH